MSSTHPNLSWRAYTPADADALRRRHALQCAAPGTAFAFPDLTDPRYVLAAVAENASGLLGAVVAHATLELMFVGGTPRMVASLARDPGWLRRELVSLGADEVHAFVPRARQRAMHPLLARLGLRPSNPDYVPYYGQL